MGKGWGWGVFLKQVQQITSYDVIFSTPTPFPIQARHQAIGSHAPPKYFGQKNIIIT